ncbi:MAG: TonB family protein, partial [Nitrospirota bacterium]
MTETSLKWMLTASLLFHLALLSIIFSSNIFKRSDLFTSQYAQLKAIHVSIVNLPKESASELTSISPDDSRIEKITVEVKKTEEIKKKEISKPVTKIEKLKEVKSVKDEMAAISEAVKKEDVIEKQKESADIRGAGVKGHGETSQLTKLLPGDGLVSGPVVDLPSFKYDYYLGLIKNKVDNRWSQPVVHNKTKQALIEFTINRNGGISNVRVADTSGDNYFDQSALRAVTLSTPFPPLPRGFKGDTLKVNYRFIFSGK